MRRREPFVQCNMTALVQRPDRCGERFTASVALVEPRAMRLALHEGRLVEGSAVGAAGSIRPNPCLKPLAGFGFVVEDGVRKVTGHGTTDCF